MNQELNSKEKAKIQKMCFENPLKSCAIAQGIINNCQVVSAGTFAKLKGKHRNTIIQQKDKLIGITIEGRKYFVFPQ